MTPAQREERIFAECTGVIPAKYPPKIKSELFSLLQSAREGKIMHTFLRESARFLQQQGLTPFPWSRSLFLIGIPFRRILRDPFHIGIALRFTKTWRASYLLIHTNVVNKKSLTSVASIFNAFSLYAVSFRVPFSLYTIGFRIPSAFIIPSACGFINILSFQMTDGTLHSVAYYL